jgi:hypothetical protein
MIENRDNLNRPYPDSMSRRPLRQDGFGWGLPLGLVVAALVIGFMLFNWSDRTTTASNTGTTTTQSTPAPKASPATPAPAPAPARPTGG